MPINIELEDSIKNLRLDYLDMQPAAEVVEDQKMLIKNESGQYDVFEPSK